jgi:hypothetical protein
MSFPDRTTTENEQLRQRVDWAEGELRRIEVETATLAIQRRDEIAKEEERKQLAAQQARDALELEQHRVNAWINSRVDSAQAAADPNAAMLALLSRDPASDIPTDLWPPGYSADDYRRIAAPPPPPDPEVSGTALGQMLAKKGVTI